MLTYIGFTRLVEGYQLCLCEPDIFIFKAYFYLGTAVFILVEKQFSLCYFFHK